MHGYRIADEPVPGPLSNAAVSPIWPLFAIMFTGAWLSWPWFILNGVAVGSPTLRREIVTAVIGTVGSIVLVFLLVKFAPTLSASQMEYGKLAIIVWKLGISYWLYMIQARTFGIYEYYGGTVNNGFFIIALAFIFEGYAFKKLTEVLGPYMLVIS